jgi:hypothetical protein
MRHFAYGNLAYVGENIRFQAMQNALGIVRRSRFKLESVHSIAILRIAYATSAAIPLSRPLNIPDLGGHQRTPQNKKPPPSL